MPRRGGSRYLIFLIDGTWLWPGSDSTLDVYSNIYHINTLLEEKGKDDQAQIVFYARGLGGVDGPRRYTAGGFAYGIDELVADLYLNLCSNYEKGDKIYILGFSRGAVVARALSGMISMGILDPQHINRLASVWDAYTGGGEVVLPGAPRDVSRDASDNSIPYLQFCSDANPSIEFIGVFDTVVGGHGLAEVAQRLRLKQRLVEKNVINSVQILAIDETRKFFRPVLWTGLRQPISTGARHFEQIWMPGVHSDIGGAYQNRFIGNISLLTMIDRMDAKTDLRFNISLAQKNFNIPLPPGGYITIHNEYTKLWRLFSPIPERRQADSQITQQVHPAAFLLGSKGVRYKKRTEVYRYSLIDSFRSLERCPEFLTSHFKTIETLIS